MLRLQMSLLFCLVVRCSAGSGNTPPGDGGGGGGNQYAATEDNNPVLRMFRNFASSFPPYGNPMNFIPPQAFPPGGAYYPGQQFAYGGGYGGPYFGANGMGYSGPYTPSGYGQPNQAYGNPTGNVPVLDTRLATGQGSGGAGASVVRTADGRYASVSVQSAPDGKPIFRSQTVTGPDSYGTAFAYSSG